MKKKPIIKIIIVLLLLLLPNTVMAEGAVPSITIAPSTFDIDTKQSETFAEEIEVKNNSTLSLSIQTEITDYSVDKYGIPNYSHDLSGWSPETWIRIEPSEFIIEAGKSRKLTIDFKIPEYAEPASYFAVILFKPVLPPTYFEAGSTHVIPYIGAVVSLNVNAERISPLKDSISVTSFSPNANWNGISFTAILKNSDVFHHSVKGEISVSNILGKENAKFTINDVTLLPKNERILTSLEKDTLLPGYYTARLYINGENDHISKETGFLVYPDPLSLILVILIISIVYFIIKKRRNLTRAISVLFSRKNF